MRMWRLVMIEPPQYGVGGLSSSVDTRPTCSGYSLLLFSKLLLAASPPAWLISVPHLPGVLILFSLLPAHNPGASVGLAAGAGVGAATGDGGGWRWCGGGYRGRCRGGG